MKSIMKFQMGSRSGVLSDFSWIVKSKTLFFQDQLDFGRISKVFEKMKSIPENIWSWVWNVKYKTLFFSGSIRFWKNF
jgi:hypothetical protein